VKGDEARSPSAVSNWARSNAARIEIPDRGILYRRTLVRVSTAAYLLYF
jgi:hypothetical protein